MFSLRRASALLAVGATLLMSFISGASAQFVASGRTNPITLGVKPAILDAEADLETHSGGGVLRKGESGAIRVTVTNRGGTIARSIIGRVQIPPSVAWGLQISSPFALGDIEPGETKAEVVPIKALEGSPVIDAGIGLDLRESGGVKVTPAPVTIRVRPPSVVNDHAGPLIEMHDQTLKASRSIKPFRPEVQIKTSRSMITLAGIVRDSSGVQAVSVGGVAMMLQWAPGGMTFERDVQLEPGVNTVEVAAADRFGNRSQLALRILRDDALIEGRFFALLIAVENYEDPKIPSLTKPIQDADRLAAVLKEIYTFEPSTITVLRNPDREGILRTMMIMRNSLTEQDNLLIFYAGHGNEDKQAKMGYWLPVNASLGQKANWLSNADIRAEIRAMKVRHVFVISDACFSGALLATRATPEELSTQRLYELPSRRAMTSGNETVPEPSVFLEQIILQLRGNKERYLLARDLFLKLRNSVEYNSPLKQQPSYGYIPEAGDQDGDFVFVRR